MRNNKIIQYLLKHNLMLWAIAWGWGVLLMLAAFYFNYFARDNQTLTVHFGFFSFSWRSFVYFAIYSFASIMGFCVCFQPLKYKYLFIGMIIGYFMFFGSGGHLYSSISMVPEIATLMDYK